MVILVFVVFIIIVEFFVSVVYIGGVFLVEYRNSLKLGNVCIMVYGNVILGKIVKNWKLYELIIKSKKFL